MDNLILVDSLNKINESLNEISKNINNLNKDKKYDRLLEENIKQNEVIDRIFNETKETRNLLNNNRDDNLLSKRYLLSYLGIVEDLLKEVSE